MQEHLAALAGSRSAPSAQRAHQAGVFQRLGCFRSAARFLVALLTAVTCALSLPQTAPAQARVACIGDSITFGAGLADPVTESYPAVLGNLLGEEFEVRNYGVNGATLLRNGDYPYWDTPAFGASSLWKPDIVIIMLGTNDSKPQNWQYGQEFERDYQELIEHYANLRSRPAVYICAPCPAVRPGAFGISPAIIQHKIVRRVWQIGFATDTPVIDVFTLLSEFPEFFPDRVHPSAEGAALIAYAVWEALMGD